MTTQMHEVAIGCVLRDGKLTTSVRIGKHAQKPNVQPAETPKHAADALLMMKYDLRRTLQCDPVVFMDSTTPVAGTALEMIRKNDSSSTDQPVDPLGRAYTCAVGGGEFANRWSELLHKFLSDVTAEKLFTAPDDDLKTELTECGKRCAHSGKLTYPLPLEVGEKLGYYPARAVATMLSTIPAPVPGAQDEQPTPLDYDPYSVI